MRIPDRPKKDATTGANLSSETISELLRMGKRVGEGSKRRVVDDLIDRLTEEGEGRWFESLLDQGPCGTIGSSFEMIFQGNATLEQLNEIKNRSKMTFHKKSERETLAGLAGYFLAVAAAMVHHGKFISSRSREEVGRILEDLAAVVPEPWDRLLLDATVART